MDYDLSGLDLPPTPKKPVSAREYLEPQYLSQSCELALSKILSASHHAIPKSIKVEGKHPRKNKKSLKDVTYETPKKTVIKKPAASKTKKAAESVVTKSDEPMKPDFAESSGKVFHHVYST